MAETRRLQFILDAQDKASAVLKSVQDRLDGMQDKLSKASDASTKVAGGLGILGAAMGALGFKSIQAAADIETQKIGFLNLLGSAEAADLAIKMIQKDAASTPFELKGLIDANMGLTLVTGSAIESERTILNVGKALAVAGKGQAELDRIITNLQQIGNTGKISEMDIRQFGYAGVNVLELLADYYGVTKEEASDMVKDSKSAFADLSGAFAKAGEEGGKFADAYTTAAGSFNQLLSNLKDTINIILANQGQKLLDFAKTIVKYFIENLPKAVDKIIAMIGWLDENRWAVVLLAGAITGALVPAVVKMALAFTAGLVALAPYIIAGGAIALFIYGIKESNAVLVGISTMMITLFIPTIVKGVMAIVAFAKSAILSMAAVGVAFWPFLVGGAVIAGVAAGITYLADRFGGFGNAMAVIGASVQALGTIVVLGFKQMANYAIDFLNSMLDKGNKAYNFVADMVNKLGGDMEHINMHVDFKFDTAAQEAKLVEIGDLVNSMEEKAAAIKAQAAAEKEAANNKEKQSNDNLLGSYEEQLAKIEELTGSKKDLSGSSKDSGEAASKEADKAKKLSSALEDLADEYKNVQKEGEDSLIKLGEDHRKTMTSIQEEIDKTIQSIQDLKAEYNNDVADQKKGLAEAFVDAESSIADLKKQLANEDDAAKKKEIQDQLTKEEEAYAASADVRNGLETQIAEVKRRNGLTDLERAIEDYNAKRALAEQEYQDKLKDLKKTLAVKQTEMAQEIALFQAKQLKIQQMIDQANIDYAVAMQTQYLKTEEVVKKEIELYKKLAQAIKDAQSASSLATLGNISVSGARASGGPVAGGKTYLVGENGPELFTAPGAGAIIPQGSAKLAGMAGGANINIYISGNEFLGEEGVADRIFNQLMRQLKDAVSL